MLLIRDTSRGRILFDFGPAAGAPGESADVYLIDREGWAQDAAMWHSRLPGEGSLADVIVRATQLSEEEAERLAGEALAEWRERGADHLSRGEHLKTVAPMVAFFSLVPLALLGLLVWLS